jgi:hypothetical protein
MVIGVLLTGLLSGCAYLAEQQRIQAELKHAKAELDKAIAQLPHFEQFDLVHQMELQWSRTEHNQTCNYARAYRIFGTQLPVPDILELYTQQLQALGWTLKAGPNEQSFMHWSRIFIRGNHERLVISTGEPGFGIRQEIDYEQLRNAYANLAVIRIEYMLPQREGC